MFSKIKHGIPFLDGALLLSYTDAAQPQIPEMFGSSPYNKLKTCKYHTNHVKGAMHYLKTAKSIEY